MNSPGVSDEHADLRVIVYSPEPICRASQGKGVKEYEVYMVHRYPFIQASDYFERKCREFQTRARSTPTPTGAQEIELRDFPTECTFFEKIKRFVYNVHERITVADFPLMYACAIIYEMNALKAHCFEVMNQRIVKDLTLSARALKVAADPTRLCLSAVSDDASNDGAVTRASSDPKVNQVQIDVQGRLILACAVIFEPLDIFSELPATWFACVIRFALGQDHNKQMLEGAVFDYLERAISANGMPIGVQEFLDVLAAPGHIDPSTDTQHLYSIVKKFIETIPDTKRDADAIDRFSFCARLNELQFWEHLSHDCIIDARDCGLFHDRWVLVAAMKENEHLWHHSRQLALELEDLHEQFSQLQLQDNGEANIAED